ncbi:unnamed protein product [Tuber melanosporum]|uniref:RNA cytidine acetyltransferase n=1 Tax=Tuber melanosporum (strain Mel28) TaxID=656061 RepID=D5GMC2_TUBMM|nr:uncharacterized protein GSTUM_00010647001 [Tuber melanosporum]CAZ85665.1 unnamed protein product [Tuber melanosporum]
MVFRYKFFSKSTSVLKVLTVVKEKKRSFFVVVGDRGKDVILNLHYILGSADPKQNKSVLWTYKKDLLGFSSHRKKREAKIKKEVKRGIREANAEDPFELFISLTNIRYCYYKETEKILGNTYGMCIIQDFEALTPNLLARTIETVEGGGLVILLLKTMTSLKQLYTMTMDIHSRYRTEAHGDVVARFNERFILSLADCASCLVVDDELNVLPISGARGVTALPPVSSEEGMTEQKRELLELKESLSEVQPVGSLVDISKTVDQAKAIMTFVDAITEKTLRSTVTLTAGRGRGKSAALGVAIAAAVAHGYSNIFITSPSPENLKTLFEFIFKGFDALNYSDHLDYDIIQSTNPAFNKAIVRVNIHRQHRQTIQYIQPQDAHVLGQAELVVVDEAAAIPLPLVKKLMGPYLVFMASTINGYEGTGRSLSLKLIQQLRDQSLREATLSEPIRYAPNDPVEKWLNNLLCLDATLPSNRSTVHGTPDTAKCELFYVNRDTLFSYHPNIPDPLCVIQVSLEGQISRESVQQSLARGRREGGDMIPWLVSQQFQDEGFASLSGARVVRIATNPDYTGMGYGSRALQLLTDFYEGKFQSLDEGATYVDEGMVRVTDEEIENSTLQTDNIKIRDRESLPPLLLRMSERRPDTLDYIGVSYGLTDKLHKFWKKQKFAPVYLRQTATELTGEHSCVMIKTLASKDNDWLGAFARDFHKRFLTLLSYEFRKFPAVLALTIFESANAGARLSGQEDLPLTKAQLDEYLSPFDLKRLESYADNMLDYHVIVDMIPLIAQLYFTGRLRGSVKLAGVQQAVLMAIGLQRKTLEDIEKELNLPPAQVLSMFQKTIRKVATCFRHLLSQAISETLPQEAGKPKQKKINGGDNNNEIETDEFYPVEQSLADDLQEGGEEVIASMKLKEKQRELINSLDLSKYEIPSTESADWESAEKQIKSATSKNSSGKSTVVSVKTKSHNKRKAGETVTEIYEQEMRKVHKKGKKSKSKK